MNHNRTRSGIENFILVVVACAWGTAVFVGIVTNRLIDPYLHYIMGGVVAGVVGVKVWRNGGS